MTEEGQPVQPTPSVDTKFWRRALPAVVITALFGVFAVQNAESTEVEFLWWSVETSRVIVLLIAAVAGAVVWEVVRGLRRRRKKR